MGEKEEDQLIQVGGLYRGALSVYGYPGSRRRKPWLTVSAYTEFS